MSTNAKITDARRTAPPNTGSAISPAAEPLAPPTSGALARIDRWLEDASERLNPILVKETRQALKSQQFVLGFLLLLAACWVVTIGGIAWIGPGVQYASSGGLLFLAYYTILVVALIVVAPFAAFRSLAAEQEDNTRDVLMVSALTPRQLIDGKIGSAALQVMVYLSALAPCLAFTYLLRGIDLLTILLVPLGTVLVSLGLSMLGLLLASAAKQRFAQVLASVALVTLLISVAFFCYSLAQEAIGQGYSNYRQWQFWVIAAVMLNGYLGAFLLMYHAAAAMNAFASANRSSALRRTLLICQFCFVGWVAVLWRITGYESEVIVYSTYSAWAFWWFAGTLLTSERPVLSERVRRGLPATPIARLLLTWFNPGPGTGYLFVASNVVTLTALASAALLFSENRSLEIDLPLVLIGAGYVLAYLGFGRLMVLGLQRLAPLSILGGFLVHFLLVLGGAGLPELIRSGFNSTSRAPFGWYDLTSPLALLQTIEDEGLSVLEMQTTLLFIAAAAACVALINTALAAREVQQTRAPLPQRVLEDDRELKQATATVSNPWGDLTKGG